MKLKTKAKKWLKSAVVIAVLILGFQYVKAGSGSNTDVGVKLIISPFGNTCGDSSTRIWVVVTNIGVNSQKDIPVFAKFSGAISGTYGDTLFKTISGGGNVDTIIFKKKLVTFSGGTFTMKIYTALSGDQDASNDTIVQILTIDPQAQTPNVTGAQGCGVSQLTLRTSAAPKGAVNYWYNNMAAITPVASGDSFVTPFISSTTSYYVKQIYIKDFGHVGKKDNTSAGGAIATFAAGLNFHSYSDFILDSVTIYPQNAATRTVWIKIKDSMTNKTLDSVQRTFTTTAANQATQVYVGIKVPNGGVYYINFEGTTGFNGFYRNTAGVSFPYTINNVVSITSQHGGTAGRYYYFYNWHITGYSCPSKVVQVDAKILTGATPSVKYSITPSCAGSPTTFTDSSTIGGGASIGSYVYDFGDGNKISTTSSVVTHVYKTPGNYKVILTVLSNAGCSDTMSKMVTIIVGPRAGFNLNYVCSGGNAIFTDKSASVAAISSYFVDFGDTSSLTSATSPVIHKYANAGTFPIIYKITNSIGCVDSTLDTITVNQSPSTPTVGNGYSCTTPSTFNLTAYSPGGGMIYKWYANATTDTVLHTGDTFTTPSITSSSVYYVVASNSKSGAVGKTDLSGTAGNNNTSNLGLRFVAATPFYLDSMTVYPNGTGRFRLVIRDSITGSIDSQTYYVAPAAAGAKVRLYVGKFIPTSGVKFIYATFLFTGGTGGLQRNTAGFTYPYTLPGVVSITGPYGATGRYYFFYDWYVHSAGCESNRVPVTANIGSGSKPVPKFTAANGCEGASIQFKDASTIASGSIASYHYDFGDGATYTSGTTGNTSHTYATAGNYKVTLAVVNSTGCGDTLSQWVKILAAPKADFSSVDACQGTLITFKDLSSNGGLRVWNFGDGDTASSFVALHAYKTAGTYTVMITASNGSCIDTISKKVNIFPLPTVKITGGDGCMGKPVSFIDGTTISSGFIQKRSWNFADGSSLDFNANPSHTFSKAGMYSIVLTSESDKGCVGVGSQNVKIDSLPVAKIDSSRKYTNGFNFSSKNNANSYSWDFGDGSTGTGKNIFHLYSATKTYWVKLKLDNAVNCSSSDSMQVTVTNAVEIIEKGKYNIGIYPNPFADNTTISYALNKPTRIKIVLKDMTGRDVAVLADNNRNAGEYSIGISASDYKLQSGVYMVCFEFENETTVHRLVKIQ